MALSHQERVEMLLSEAAVEHPQLIERLPAELRASLPVDGQGLTRSIRRCCTRVSSGLPCSRLTR